MSNQILGITMALNNSVRDLGVIWSEYCEVTTSLHFGVKMYWNTYLRLKNVTGLIWGKNVTSDN